MSRSRRYTDPAAGRRSGGRGSSRSPRASGARVVEGPSVERVEGGQTGGGGCAGRLEVGPGCRAKPFGWVRVRCGTALRGVESARVSRSATAAGPPSRYRSISSARFQAAVPVMLNARGGRRVRVPRTSSRLLWNTVWAQRPWLSSKNARSDRPVGSSRVAKMTRLPERIGGVWVATLTPATSTVEPCRRPARSAAGVAPMSASRERCSSRRWREMSMPSTSSSAASCSDASMAGRPVTASAALPMPSPSDSEQVSTVPSVLPVSVMGADRRWIRRAAPRTVQLGDLQQKLTAGPERAQRTDPGEAFGQRAAGPGALPEVLDRGVRLPGHDASALGLGDAAHLRETDPHTYQTPVRLCVRPGSG